jgi:hypothetical protein
MWLIFPTYSLKLVMMPKIISWSASGIALKEAYLLFFKLEFIECLIVTKKRISNLHRKY